MNTADTVQQALHTAITQVRQNIPSFTDVCQNHSSVQGFYPPCPNTQWTCGFWPGEIWLCYEATGDKIFRDTAEVQVKSFVNRIELSLFAFLRSRMEGNGQRRGAYCRTKSR